MRFAMIAQSSRHKAP